MFGGLEPPPEAPNPVPRPSNTHKTRGSSARCVRLARACPVHLACAIWCRASSRPKQKLAASHVQQTQGSGWQPEPAATARLVTLEGDRGSAKVVPYHHISKNDVAPSQPCDGTGDLRLRDGSLHSVSPAVPKKHGTWMNPLLAIAQCRFFAGCLSAVCPHLVK